MEVTEEVNRLYRSEAGKLITSLVSFFNLKNLQLAEDIVQETFIAALTHWEKNGLPDKPVAWLYKVCKNKAINELERKTPEQLSNFSHLPNGNYQLEQAFLPEEIKDNQLRLLFALCHPDFSDKTQIMLTLKTLAGFRQEEIASALFTNTEAVKKQLTRVKKKIADQNMPLKVPFVLQSKKRLESVHRVLYLLFNEGYRASTGTVLIKKELCLEAIRLTKSLLEEEKVCSKDTYALFALMLFNVARFEARIDEDGVPIPLEEQDRSSWDQKLIADGVRLFNIARQSNQWSKYHIEAGIASIHSTSASFSSTPWQAILNLYDQLSSMDSSSFVAMNRFIALFYCGKRTEAIEGLLKLKDLKQHHSYLAVLGKMYQEQEQVQEALNHYLEAYQCAPPAPEKKFIARKIESLKKEVHL